MNHGSLFSGIGGFDLAAERMGWTNVFHCEWMDFPRKVLHHYWPEATSYVDITTTDFTLHAGQIDVLTGGFPCQPYSAAGKRKGKDDDRHLWPHMLRAIREIRPRYVVGENVFGLTTWNGGVVLEEVCTDLEAEGYAVQPFIIPAAAVGAPHRRDRVWIVAYNTNAGYEGLRRERQNTVHELHHATDAGRCGTELEPFSHRIPERKESIDKSEVWHATDADCRGLQIPQFEANEPGTNDTFATRISRQYTWENWPTVAPVCSGDDGLPRELDGITFPKWRNESIKGYGNAIVPQVAMQIFAAIEQYEQLTKENT
jgi:DNA (cytosine-5)-methyltransferase 1